MVGALMGGWRAGWGRGMEDGFGRMVLMGRGCWSVIE